MTHEHLPPFKRYRPRLIGMSGEVLARQVPDRDNSLLRWQVTDVTGLQQFMGKDTFAAIYEEIPEEKERRARLREKLAQLKHEQWTFWSKAVAPEVSPGQRSRWEKLWVPYGELAEYTKELHREWADRVLAIFDEESK